MHIRLEYAELSSVYHAISAEVPLISQVKSRVFFLRRGQFLNFVLTFLESGMFVQLTCCVNDGE
jgi:tRNA threonylcarbamoyladenosine modification (KEOPS) complex  Pcc1 subunit